MLGGEYCNELLITSKRESNKGKGKTTYFAMEIYDNLTKLFLASWYSAKLSSIVESINTKRMNLFCKTFNDLSLLVTIFA